MPNIVLLESKQINRIYPVIIREIGGYLLTDYPILIELNNENFFDWDRLDSKGYNLQITDYLGNPLYYYPEKIDLNLKKALIWVKLPYLKPYSEFELKIQINERNPFINYLDATKVFLLYDDFLWSYAGSGTSSSSIISLPNGWYLRLYDGGSGAGDVVWSINVGDSIATLTSKDGQTDGGAEIVGLRYDLDKKTNIAIKFKAKYPNWGGTGAGSYYRAYDSGFRNDNVTGGGGVSRADYMLNEYGRRICSNNASGGSCTSDLNVLDPTTIQDFVVYELRLLPTKIKLFYDLGEGLVFWGEKTDYVPSEDYESAWFSVASWGAQGPFEIDVDWVYVRPYYEPEPEVIVGKPFVAFKGSYDLY